MNLKLRYNIIDLSLKNPKIQELPGALPPGLCPPTTRFISRLMLIIKLCLLSNAVGHVLCGI